MTTPTTSQRDLRIDFLRGLALIFIFWDHIPGNWMGHITLRNIGFSDAAELFVFLAGYAAALAYQRRYRTQGYFVTALHILRRIWVLYIAHVFLLAQLMAVIFIVNDFVPTRDFIEETGLRYFVSNPVKALVDALMLRFKPVLMDPLPLYIILLGALAAVLPAVVRYPGWVFALSAAIYYAAVTKQWNINAQPGGVWFFNPLAWQFLFFLGALCGVHQATLKLRVERLGASARRHLIAALGIGLVFSAAVALSWSWPEWHDRWIPQTLARWLYPIDKTNLSPLRVVHFLALATLVALLMPQGKWLRSPAARAVQLMGRHSLAAFCFSVLLAPVADCLNTLAGDAMIVQTLTSIAGVMLMALIALLPEWFAKQQALAAQMKSVPQPGSRAINI